MSATLDLQAEDPVLEQLQQSVSLSQGAQRGAAWIGGARVLTQAAQFLVSIVMARLLFPSAFGEAAIALTVAAFGTIFTELGLGSALVQSERLTPRLLASAFWLNLITGFALTALVAGAAFPLAALYGQPGLVAPLLVVSATFTLSSAVVQTALLERTFHYRKLAIVETSAALVATLAMPAAALAGLGPVSLVIGPVGTAALITLALWILVPWRPRGRPHRGEIRHLWAYARGLIGFNTVTFWSRNLDTLLLGRTVGAHALGEYARSYNLMTVPVQQMSVVLGRVLFPSLARLQHDHRRMGDAWFRATAAAGAVTLPVAVTFAATAPALVEVLYGSRWSGMVPVLELLSVGALPQILVAPASGVFRATGRTGLLFRIGLLTAVMSMLAVVAGLPWGTRGVATALLVAYWLALLIAVIPLARIVELSPVGVLRGLAATLRPALVLAATELAVRWLVPAGVSAWAVLPLQLSAGGVAYLAALWVFQREALVRIVRRALALLPRRARAVA